MNKKLFFSDHAILRIYQNKMDEEMCQEIFKTAVRVMCPKSFRNMKFKKYKLKQVGVRYYYGSGFLFTVNRNGWLISLHEQPMKPWIKYIPLIKHIKGGTLD